MVRLKTVGSAANSADPNQMLYSVTYDLDLQFTQAFLTQYLLV